MFRNAHDFRVSGGNYYIVQGDLHNTIHLPPPSPNEAIHSPEIRHPKYPNRTLTYEPHSDVSLSDHDNDVIMEDAPLVKLAAEHSTPSIDSGAPIVVDDANTPLPYNYRASPSFHQRAQQPETELVSNFEGRFIDQIEQVEHSLYRPSLPIITESSNTTSHVHDSSLLCSVEVSGAGAGHARIDIVASVTGGLQFNINIPSADDLSSVALNVNSQTIYFHSPQLQLVFQRPYS